MLKPSVRLPWHLGPRRPQVSASPPKVLALGFIGLILLGMLLLKLPWATHHPIGWFEALFTSVSAVTVTGLSIVNIATGLTMFGKSILLVLVQIGGLGFVSFTILAATTLGRHITLGQQALAMEAFHQTNVAKLHQTAYMVIRYTFAIQFIAMLLLALWWYSDGASVQHAVLQAIFHVSMSFNNAGFTLFEGPQDLFYRDAPTVLITTAAIILGGIGFPVLQDLFHHRRWSRFSVYSRAVIIATIVLNVVGFIVIWAIESNNPLTIKHLSWWQQALASWLQAVASRTTGYEAMNAQLMHNSSVMLLMFYMFVGGGSFSTASGIKINTLIVLFLAVRAYFRQQGETVIMSRTIPASTIQKALALVFVTVSWIILGVFFISLFDDLPFRSVLFEVVSAITTTGMNNDLTALLSTPSQILILLYMYIGRLGPLTLVYALATRRVQRVRYAETHFQVG